MAIVNCNNGWDIPGSPLAEAHSLVKEHWPEAGG